MTAAEAGTNWLEVGGGVLLFLYFAALVAFDRYLSARPSRNLLLEYLRTLKGGAGHPRPTDPDARAAFDSGVATIDARVEQAEREVRPKGANWFTRRLRPISVTKVLSTWREAHAIEAQSWQLATRAELESRLRSAGAELQAFAPRDPAAAVAWALEKQITSVLDPPSHHLQSRDRPTFQAKGWQLRRMRQPEPASRDELCGLLQEALRVIVGQRDKKFETLASRQTQSVWLAVLGLSLIVVADVAAHRPSLFLFGALGAFISRLARVQSRTPSDDYGVSSGALYLSIVAGAIAGWVGVLVVNALALPSIHVLSGSFRGIWDNPTHILPSAIAVAFGFSERLLNKVLRQAGDTVSATSTTSEAGPAPSRET